MDEHFLIGFATIIVLGIGAYWVSWRLRIPAILLLLASGFVAGPVTGLINPDEIFGDILLPVVTASVAVILFEGGMNLKFSELREIRKVVISLVTVGVLVTWAVTAVAAYFLFGFSHQIASLLGAILVVTGPTVIMPLLRNLRPTSRMGSIMKWEGIVIDPIGAMLAVLVFQAVVAGGVIEATEKVGLSVLKTVIVGGAVGVAGGRALIIIMKRYWVPDYLLNSVTLMILIAAFTFSDFIQKESGFVTVTIMGIVLANQKEVSIKHIMEFKDTLRVLFISSLFIILSSRLTYGDLQFLMSYKSALFLLVLFVIARPLCVFLSTRGSGLQLKEKLFLSWMAPRGIVAASVASVFGLKLVDDGFAQAQHLVSITFLVITATVLVYGLTAPPLARKLGVAKPDPQGVLFVGAHDWARAMAKFLHEDGFKVSLVDSSWENVSTARQEGLMAHYKNIILDDVAEHVDCEGIGKLLALTSNDEVNSLAALSFVESFGRSQVYQLPRQSGRHSAHEENVVSELTGRFLFSPEATYEFITFQFGTGAVIKKTQITAEFDYEAFRSHHGGKVVPLFLIKENGDLLAFANDNPPAPQPGHHLVALVAEITERREGNALVEGAP
ncbi:MAG TPA: cation:proton antiporter [Thermodesulfobacteriota bacterium]|nr:cation:proton antiporter [Thermodesulfobacteriota bacterium]